MNLSIRHEKPSDYRIVEELTREAFWNHHVPGCDEHLYLHKLRNLPSFLPQLDLVILNDTTIIGHIAYTTSHILTNSGQTIHTVTFGPVSILPKYQHQGIGDQFIRYSMAEVKKLGYPAILIYGFPDYYQKFGFISASNYRISNPEGKYPTALLAVELVSGALQDAEGRFFEETPFSPTEEELNEFDSTFPPKEKLVTEGQTKFAIMSTSFDTP